MTEPTTQTASETAFKSDFLRLMKARGYIHQITHPAELPPITMMNWLVLIEERRGEFQ